MSIRINEIVDMISKLNVLEVIDLTKAIEKKFDITFDKDIGEKKKEIITNPEKVEENQEEKMYSIIMTNYGNSKINVIKTVRTILSLGLKEAKDFVEKLPAIIKENIQKSDTVDIKKKLEDAGATIELKIF